MVEAASYWIKLGVMYDGSGFKKAIVGMFDLTNAAGNLYNTFRKVVDVNSDLYNTSNLLDISTGDLQRWQRTFELLGYSADSARDTISNLNFVWTNLRWGEDKEKLRAFQLLRGDLNALADMKTTLIELNRIYQRVDKQTFEKFARQMGLNNGALQLVMRSEKDFMQALKDGAKLPVIPEHQLRAARELNKEFTELAQSWDIFKSGAISSALPTIKTLFTELKNALMDDKNTESMKRFFAELEQGFNNLAESGELKEVIRDLADLLKALAEVGRWGMAGARGVKHAAEAVGAVAGTVVGTVTTPSVYQKWLNPGFMAPAGMMIPTAKPWGSSSGSKNITVNQTNNINGGNPGEVKRAVAAGTAQGLGTSPEEFQRATNQEKAGIVQ